MQKNSSIKARLSLAFVVVVGLFALTLVVVATYLGSLTHDVRTINDSTLPDLMLVDDMNLARSDVQQFLTDVAATHEKDGYKDAEAAYQRFKAGVEKFRTQFKQANDSANLDAINRIDTDFTQFYDLGKVMAEAYISQGMEAGNVLMKGTGSTPGFDKASETIQAELEKFHATQVEAANSTTQQALGKANSMVTVMLISGLAAVVLAIGFGAWFVRGILRQLGGEPAPAVALAEHVGAGDLTHEVALRAGDSNSLLWQLKTMQQNLANVVSRVRRNAEGVAAASIQVAEGNHELADRTSHQASTLEETATTMKELATAVGNNADSARTANQLALNAANVASQGGEVVAQVVETMKGINESSRKIADIISVIDGIAFQTNILALNAAVEAARAGEQGRGFAVVASEVRSLAGRSAEAAKEIKSLITASVERVEQGTALVDQAGTTMDQVVKSIREVTDIVGQISTASHNQSQGVAQMGEAVVQMEHTTQQNAAMVEEIDSAANTLRMQAADLLQAVQAFQLPGHNKQAQLPANQRSIPTLRTPAAKPPAAIRAPAPSKAPTVRSSAAPRPSAPPRQLPAAKPKAAEQEEWETF
jgi:methyl-accepting chemotaxis protein